MREDYNRETLRVRPYPPSLSRVGEKVAEQAAEIDRLTAEVERLAEWKRSAIGVLAAWDAVFDALGQPGPLGGSKAENALAEVERLRGELEAERSDIKMIIGEVSKVYDHITGGRISYPHTLAEVVTAAADEYAARTAAEPDDPAKCDRVSAALDSYERHCDCWDQMSPCCWCGSDFEDLDCHPPAPAPATPEDER